MKLNVTTFIISIAVVILIGAAWDYSFRDYSHYFLRHKGNLTSSSATTIGEDAIFLHQSLTLKSDSGLQVACGMLIPKRQATGVRYPAVVLLGGVETGKEAIRYITGMPDVIIVAPDYQYKYCPVKNTLQFLREVPAIRKGALQTVSAVMLAIDYLARRPDVDRKRIIMAGYSFGAPFVPCVAALDRRTAVAGMAYGAGDLPGLIRHNFRGIGPVRSEAMALLAAVLLRPVEPLRYADRISPTPLVMINGTEDELIPRRFAEEFFDKAKQPKQLIWLKSVHMTPENWALTKRITAVMRDRLIEMGLLLPPKQHIPAQAAPMVQ